MKRDLHEMLHIGETCRSCTRASQCTPKHSLSSPQTTARPRLLKNNNTQTDRYWLKLTNTANKSTGQNLIAYIPDATNSYDNGLDGLYLNDGAVAFYSMANTKEVVINARPIFEVNDVIPLVFQIEIYPLFSCRIHIMNLSRPYTSHNGIFLRLGMN